MAVILLLKIEGILRRVHCERHLFLRIEGTGGSIHDRYLNVKRWALIAVPVIIHCVEIILDNVLRRTLPKRIVILRGGEGSYSDEVRLCVNFCLNIPLRRLSVRETVE